MVKIRPLLRQVIRHSGKSSYLWRRRQPSPPSNPVSRLDSGSPLCSASLSTLPSSPPASAPYEWSQDARPLRRKTIASRNPTSLLPAGPRVYFPSSAACARLACRPPFFIGTITPVQRYRHAHRFRRHTLLGCARRPRTQSAPAPNVGRNCLGSRSRLLFDGLSPPNRPVKFLALTWCQVRYDPRRLFRRMRCPTPFHQSRLQLHRTNRPL